MMTISAIHNIDYYLKLASQDDYYHSETGNEPAGLWAGLGARQLGLTGIISTSDYQKILQGFAPDGQPLTDNAGEHRPGWDLTFSAPKSVSVLWARSGEEQRQLISQAHQQAVCSAVQFLERHAAYTRRGHGGKNHEPTAGLVALLFEHATSRELDPALHTHALIANVAPRLDDSWGTIESKYLFNWQKAAGSFYRSVLTSKLRQIGYQIQRPEKGNYFEVAGIPNTICVHYSKRTQAIKKRLAETNTQTSASKIGNLIKLQTRTHKQKIDRPELFALWANEMDQMGFSLDDSRALTSHELSLESEPLPEVSIVQALTEKQPLFRLQDIYESVGIAAQYISATPDEIEATVHSLIEERSIIKLGLDLRGQLLFSTPEMLAIEQNLVINAQLLNENLQHRLSDGSIQQAISRVITEMSSDPARIPFCFSEEQLESIYSACQSGLDIVQGSAGAGKTTTMVAVRMAYESAGYSVIGAAVARKAATQLQSETGISSTTIAKLTKDLDDNKITLKNKILVIDEAGQVPSGDLRTLVEAVRKTGAKIVLVGEDRQLDAISHGGALRYLSKKFGCARIQNIKRQHEEWARRSVMQLRDGQALRALQTFDQRGLLSWAPSAEDCQEQLVCAWESHSERFPARRSLVLAQRWQDIAPISEKIRALRQNKGLVKNENIELDCSVTDDRHLNFTYSTGDRIKLCKNDYKLGVENGTLGTITKIVSKGDGGYYFNFRADDGRNLQIDTQQYCDKNNRPYFSLAYALTVYASQGCTVDDTFIYYTTSMDRANTYVAGSRHRQSCQWFINEKEIDAKINPALSPTALRQERLLALAEHMSTDNYKQLAIEYLAVECDDPRMMENHREKYLEHEI